MAVFGCKFFIWSTAYILRTVFLFTRKIYHWKEEAKILKKKYILLKYVVFRPLTTKINKNSKFGKSRSKCQKNILLKKSCRGIGPRVRYTKNQLPRQKTLAKNFVRSVTIFRPEKTKKMA